jgi:hypothetical protein
MTNDDKLRGLKGRSDRNVDGGPTGKIDKSSTHSGESAGDGADNMNKELTIDKHP